MSVDFEKLTERDIRDYKRDIENYKRKQKMFLVLGFVFTGLFVLFLAMSVVGFIFAFASNDIKDVNFGFLAMGETGATFASIFLVAFLAMFILRGALFTQKINNRERIIEEWEGNHK